MAKKSTVIAAALAAVVVVAAGIGIVVAINGSNSAPGSGPGGSNAPSANGETQTVTMRIWDDQVAAAYEKSFAQLEEEQNIHVDLEVIPWGDYWTKLRTDIAGNTIDDIFWVNSGNFETYATNGNLLDITKALGADAQQAWQASVVEQYTLNGSLWGVPQLADPGIGVFYNTELLADAGLTPADLNNLRWDPTGENDTLLPVLQKLTVDANGVRANEPGFDPNKIVQYGYNAANDLNAIYINYLGSNGAAMQDGTEFVFASPEGKAAFQYLVDLINKYHVSPSAADTNQNGDFSRDQFLQGKMALFQTGSYNLANVDQGVAFEWGVAPLPAGPAGAISVTNGIIAASNAKASNPDAVKAVLKWIGSGPGSEAIGENGSASPAVLAAQSAYRSYWSDQGVDVSALFTVLDNGTVQAPQGANWGAAQDAFGPIFEGVFAGRTAVDSGLDDAQAAANTAMRG